MSGICVEEDKDAKIVDLSMKMRSREDAEPCCIYCQQNHNAMDRRCQEYQRQVKMREIMALHNVSLNEADKTCKR